MNRSQRRMVQRNQPAYKLMNHDQLMNALAKNGITADDLKAAKLEAYRNGVESAIMSSYAAFCLAMDEVLHTDKETMLEVLQNADNKIVVSLDSEDLIDDVFKRYGIQIDFRDSLERVKEDETHGGHTTVKN